MNYANSPRADDSRRGFTLVELQIAMLIMTLIALLMAGAMRATVQAWEKSTNRQDVAEHRFLVDQFLRRHLAGMHFTRFKSSSGGNMVGFMGTEESVHFVAPFPGFDNDGALYWWTLKNQWVEEVEQNRLVLQYLPYDKDQIVEYDSLSGIAIEDLERGQIIVDETIRVLSIDYFERSSSASGSWTREWEPGRQIPQAVRLRLVEIDANGQAIPLPDIAIAPRFNLQRLTYSDGG